MVRQLLVIGLVAAALLTYLGFLLAEGCGGGSAQPEVDRAEERSAAARLVGDGALRELAAAWDDETLRRVLDPKTHAEPWFEDLAAQMPIFREDLGAVRELQGDAKLVPGPTGAAVRLYDYRARAEFERGAARVRLLVAEAGGSWSILACEVVPEALAEPVPEPDAG